MSRAKEMLMDNWHAKALLGLGTLVIGTLLPVTVFAQEAGVERPINSMKLPFLREASSGGTEITMLYGSGGTATGSTGGGSTSTGGSGGTSGGGMVNVEPGGLISQGNHCRFRDIDGNSSATAINYLYDNSIAGGRRPCYFDPNSAATRAEITAMAVRAVDAPLPVSAEPKAFPDTDLQSWSPRFVKAAKNADIVHGYPDGYFRAEKPVNVVEALKITTRAFKSDFSRTNLQQLSKIRDIELNQWYIKYVQAGLNEQIIDANATQIYPATQVTRAEVADMIYILMKRRE